MSHSLEREGRRSGGQCAGRKFWFRWNTLAGSYAVFSAVSRASLAAGYARRTPRFPSASSSVVNELTYTPLAYGSSDVLYSHGHIGDSAPRVTILALKQPKMLPTRISTFEIRT